MQPIDEMAPSLGGYLLFVALSFPVCCVSLIELPGAHVTLAPMLYLLIGRRWGFLPGLAATVVLTAPSLWLWDSPIKPALAIGHFLFVWNFRYRAPLMGESTALYNIIVLPLAGILLVGWNHPSLSISLLILAEYLVCEVLLAAGADVVMQNFVLTRHWPYLVPRASRSLDRVLRAMINFVVALLFCVTLVNEAGSFNRLEHSYRTHIRSVVSHVLRDSGGGVTPLVDRTMDVTLFDDSRVRLFISSMSTDFAERARAHLGLNCRSFIRADEPDDRIGHLLAWASVCEIDEIHEGGRTLYVATSFHDSMAHRYDWLGPQLILLCIAGFFTLMYRISLTRALRRTLESCERAVESFGQPNLPRVPNQPFRELDGPLRQFVERNNAYVGAIDERDRLTRVAQTLKHSIDLQLMKDISFSPETGRLRFAEIRLSEDPQVREFQVHAGDCPQFSAVSGSDEAMIEFRTAGGDELETFLITLRQSVGTCTWDSGMSVKLRQSKQLRNLMIRQARLIDLGSMASTISHEIKQPLFTIAMAAESIQIILGKHQLTAVGQSIDRFAARISTQVDRAREIIRRISQHGNTDTADLGSSDAAEAMHASYSFLLPLIDERGIAVTTKVAPGPHMVQAARIALEQVIVNAIQNAVDAIQTARDRGRPEAGHLTLVVDSENDEVCCAVIDDGIGLAAGIGETAFNPFFTTKSIDKGTGLGLFISRQIITEAGGTIRLLPGTPHGAQLRLTLPLSTAEDAVSAQNSSPAFAEDGGRPQDGGVA